MPTVLIATASVHVIAAGFTNKGFPIPMVKGVAFVNPKLSLGEVCEALS